MVCDRKAQFDGASDSEATWCNIGSVFRDLNSGDIDPIGIACGQLPADHGDFGIWRQRRGRMGGHQSVNGRGVWRHIFIVRCRGRDFWTKFWGAEI